MTTVQPVVPVDSPPPAPTSSGAGSQARISFRQPVSPDGFIDAAWWPRSLDLVAEFEQLLDVLWTGDRDITRITYNIHAWNPAPHRMTVQGRVVRLGGFNSSDPTTVRLSDPWGRERIDVLVIAPDTDPAVAQRILALASVADSTYRAEEILALAKTPAAA
jgi:hypothetical protein